MSDETEESNGDANNRDDPDEQSQPIYGTTPSVSDPQDFSPPVAPQPFGYQSSQSDPYGQQFGTPGINPPLHQNPAPMQGTYYSTQSGYSVSGPQTDPFAIASLVLGLVSIVFVCCCMYIGIAAGTIGAVLGFMSINRIKDQQYNVQGHSMAIAGVTTSIIGILLCIAYLLFTLVFNLLPLVALYQ